MAKFDVDGTGARTIVASPYTLMLYEQTFHSSLIADWYDKVDLKRGAEGTEWVTSGVVMSALSRANGGRELPAEVKALVRSAFPAQVDTVLDYTANKWRRHCASCGRCSRPASKSTAPTACRSRAPSPTSTSGWPSSAP